jgi:hypothetical protein
MENYKKQIKSLIGGLITNDTKKINSLVKELSESVVPEKEDYIMKVLIESFRGETNV